MAYQFNTLMQVIFCEPIVDSLIEASIQLVTLPSNFFITGFAFKAIDVERGEFEIGGSGSLGFNAIDYDNLGFVSFASLTEPGQAANAGNFNGGVLPANTPLFIKISSPSQGYIEYNLQMIISGYYI